MNKSNESNEIGKKTYLFFKKSSNFEFRRNKFMTLTLFEVVDHFMMDSFLLKLTQFEKNRSLGKTFISLGNLIKISIFEINFDHVFL